jgi:hypothetical protein
LNLSKDNLLKLAYFAYFFLDFSNAPIILLCVLEVGRLITKVAALEICTKEIFYCVMIKLNLPSGKFDQRFNPTKSKSMELK